MIETMAAAAVKAEIEKKAKEIVLKELKKVLDAPIKKAMETIIPKDTKIAEFKSTLKGLDAPLQPKREFADDNGKVFRIGKELLPNTNYELGGYSYKTDRFGRIVSAEGDLHLTERTDRKTINVPIEDIGKGSERPTDERGHLIGDRFDGSNTVGNLVSMDKLLNDGDYKAFENKCADALKQNKPVHVSMNITYEGTSNRPATFMVSSTIDGEKSAVHFRNGIGE